MKCKNKTSAKVLFGCFNTLFFTCGFLEVITGFLLLNDFQRVELSRLLTSPEVRLPQPPFYYVALAMLVSGLVLCCVAAMGCWATYMPGYVMLTVYFLSVVSLLVATCGSAAVATIWRNCAGLEAGRGGGVGALQAYYAVPDYEQFTAAVDLAQTVLQCCGMSDARDYALSAWQLRRLGPRGMSVPPTCCVQAAPSPRDPAPASVVKCQELNVDPMYRHVPGCLGKLEEWYQQQYIIFMMVIFVLALFKLAILLSTIFSCIQLRQHRRDKHSFIIKTIQKPNDNIYDMKLHDEPITAKYVQPNNFYSPRVRNPRMFHTKPNEMV